MEVTLFVVSGLPRGMQFANVGPLSLLIARELRTSPAL